MKKPKLFSDIKAVPTKKEREKQIDNLIGVFTDPIICYRGGGGAYIPEHLKSVKKVRELSPYLLRELNDLKRWIKRKQVRHRKKIKRA